jgi:hypothetical protein
MALVKQGNIGMANIDIALLPTPRPAWAHD